MIQVNNLNKQYQTKSVTTKAVDDLSIHIREGEFVSIMGPSGCGKSSLLNILGLLDNFDSGELIIDGQNVDQVNDQWLANFRNQKLGFIFQSFHLIPELTVRENVEMPLTYRKDLSAKQRKKQAIEILESVGLDNRLNHFPAQLSGGQQQRVAIARALVTQPKVLLADEPTGNLDSKTTDEIMGLLINLNKEKGATIVMVTHDDDHAHITDRCIRLLDGKLQDSQSDTQNQPQLKSA